MIIVDTSVWVDHLRTNDDGLVKLLDGGGVAMHPFILGELALGNLAQRARVVSLLGELPTAPMVTIDDVLAFIDRHQLPGSGVGYVDTHLLASAALLGRASLWTRDKRLSKVAIRLGLATGF